MNPKLIFAPLMALVALTFCVMFFVAYKRFSAGFAGRVRPRAFRAGESPDVPEDVRIANRNFVNLFEMPVLFYTLCLALYATAAVSAALLALAWIYVALRAVHSLIHLSYNRILHRFAAYAAGNFILLAMWVMFALNLCRRL